MAHRRSPRSGARQYPRTARLNQLLREILAETLENIDDDRLDLVTITSVDVDADLNMAKVFFDSWQGPEGDPLVLEGLADARTRLRGAVGREARIKRVPDLSFFPDPAVRAGAQIEGLLRDLGPLVDIPVPDEEGLDVGPDDGAMDEAP